MTGSCDVTMNLLSPLNVRIVRIIESVFASQERLSALCFCKYSKLI